MALQGVPWFIGQVGAKHPPEAARLLAYVATGSAEGIVSAGDLAVRALDVPGAGVQVMPGAAVLLNRFTGGGQQTYLVQNDAAEQVMVTPTGSSGGRTDLVAVIVEDPQYAGQPAPTDLENGPYCRFVVYTDVSPTATTLAEVDPGQAGIALARYTLGASDGTIEKADITDLRNLVQPRTRTVTRMHTFLSSASADSIDTAGFSDWPVPAKWSVEVPSWAVKAQLKATISGIQSADDGTDGGNWWGQLRAVLGGATTPAAQINVSSIGPGRVDTFMAMAADDIVIPKSYRGQMKDLRAQALRDGSSGGLDVRSGWGTNVVLEVTFYEDADADYWEA